MPTLRFLLDIAHSALRSGDLSSMQKVLLLLPRGRWNDSAVKKFKLIHYRAIGRLDHTPVPRVGPTLQPLVLQAQELRPFRHQDGADLNFLRHGRLSPRAH